MTSARRDQIVAQVISTVCPQLEPQRLCAGCAEVAGVSGAGIMLLSDDVSKWTLNDAAPIRSRIEDLQFALREGPGIDAHSLGVPVFEPDLTSPVQQRWPSFTSPAVEAGVRAVFGFPWPRSSSASVSAQR